VAKEEKNSDKGQQFLMASFLKNTAAKQDASAQNRNLGVFSSKGAKELVILNKNIMLLNKSLINQQKSTSNKKDFVRRDDPNNKLIKEVDDLQDLMRENNKLTKKQGMTGKGLFGGLLGGLGKLLAVGGLLGFLLTGKSEFLFSIIKGAKKVLFDVPAFLKSMFNIKGVFSGAKAIGKMGMKGTAKTALKKIPGIGTLMGIFFGIERFKKGDVLGGIGEIASGISSMFPGVGTIISTVIDAALLVRDFKKSFGKGKDAGTIQKSSPTDWRKIPVIGSFLDIFEGFKMVMGGSPIEGIKMALLGINSFKIPGMDFVISKTLFPLVDAGAWLVKETPKFLGMVGSKVVQYAPAAYEVLKKVPVIGWYINAIEGLINFAKDPKAGVESIATMMNNFIPGSGDVLIQAGGVIFGAADWIMKKAGNVASWAGGAMDWLGKKTGDIASAIGSSNKGIREGLRTGEKPGDRNILQKPKMVIASTANFIKDKVDKVSDWLGIKAGRGVDFSGVKPSILSNFTGMAKDYFDLTGKNINVNSAYRNPEQQKKLYEEAVRTGRTGFVAKPGRSLHEFGYALDIDSKDANKLDDAGLMRKWGFWRPLLKSKHKEPWHVEPMGLDRASVRSEPDSTQIGDRNLPSRSIGDRVYGERQVPIDLSDKTIGLLAEAMGMSFKGAIPRSQTPRVSFNTSMRG
jgi:hypothetical protein